MRLENYFPFTTLDILTDNIKRDYRISENKLMLEVPGFNKKDLQVGIENGILKIEGKKDIENNSFSIKREFKIPSVYSTDIEKIKARVNDGILIIEFSEENKKKMIEIS